MTPADRTVLCTVASAAWRQAPRSARRVCFPWRQQWYTVRSTGFRLLVDDAHGRPVACRWY